LPRHWVKKGLKRNTNSYEENNTSHWQKVTMKQHEQLPQLISMGFQTLLVFLIVFSLANLEGPGIAIAKISNESLLEELGEGPKEPNSIFDSTEDLLEELDADVLDKQAQNQVINDSSKEEIFQIFQNFSGSLRMRYYYFFQPVDDPDDYIDKTRHFSEGRLKFKTFYRRPNLRFNISGWAESGFQKQTYSGVSDKFQDNDRRRNYLELNSFFLNGFFDNFNISLGKKIFIDGLSTIYSPANRYGARDLNDPFDPRMFGNWIGQVDVPIKNLGITLAVLPIYQNVKSPSNISRWVDRSKWNVDRSKWNNALHSNLITEEEIPDFAWEDMSYFFRTKGVFKGWDLFLSLFHGFNQYAVIREEIDGVTVKNISEVVAVFNLATGFSTTMDKWEFHGEALYNYTFESKDDNYIASMVGLIYGMDDYVDKIGLEKFDLVLELGHEVILSRQNADNYVRSSKKARPMKKTIIIGGKFQVNKDLKFHVQDTIELKEKGNYIRLGMSYNFTPEWKLDLDVEYFDGSGDSYFGYQRNNDRFITALTYFF
jgi:hypothetical protein